MARALTYTTSTTQIIETSMAKSHLRVSSSADDTYIQNLIFAATHDIEHYLNCNLMEASCTQWCDTWEDTLELYHSPIMNTRRLSVTTIRYYKDDTLTTWDASNYIVDNVSSPTRIGLANNKTYPTIDERIGAIQINYTSGFSEVSQVPQDIKQAILILVGQWYENRQEAVVGRSVGVIPLTARYILDKYRIRTFGLPC